MTAPLRNSAKDNSASSSADNRDILWRPKRASVSGSVAQYSKFVAFMKIALPAAAGFLLLLVIALPLIREQEDRFRIGTTPDKSGNAESLSMTNVRYYGTNEKGEPFSVTASTFRQNSPGDNIVELTLPKGEITLSNGTGLSVSADTGVYDRERQILDLSGNVALFEYGGNELHTTQAHIVLKDGIATGHEPTTGHGPFGTLEAAGFEYNKNQKVVRFLGRIKAALNTQKNKDTPTGGGPTPACFSNRKSVMIRIRLNVFVGAMAAIFFVAPALGQTLSLHLEPKNKEPIDITADLDSDVDLDGKRVTFRGNAKAVQGAVSVAADQLIADYRESANGGDNEIYRVFATGNVTMKSASETATGQNAVYHLDKAVFVIEGPEVKLVSADGMVMSHRVLQYWSNERVAVAEGNAYAEDKDKRKIHGDKLVAFFREIPPGGQSSTASNRGDINFVQGFGNVRVDTDVETIRGERGSYNVDTGIATVEGSVKVTRGTLQSSAPFMVINMKGGKSAAYANPAQAGLKSVTENPRVRVLIAPKASPDDGAAKKPPQDKTSDKAADKNQRKAQ